jgi:amino acid adenylation domain-containing protein
MIDSKRLYQLRIAAGKRVKERDYWLNRLSGEPAKSSFPAYYKRKGAAGQSLDTLDKVKFEFSKALSAKLLKLSTGSDARLHILLAAGLTLLIHKYTGSEDIIIGTPIYRAGTGANPINTVLTLRTRLEKSMTIKQLLLDVKQSMIEANENRNYPVEVLAEQLNIPFGDNTFSLFDIAILVEDIHDREYLNRVNPGMIFAFSRSGQSVTGYVEYNALLYERSGIDRIIIHFKNLMQAALSNPAVRTADIEILTDHEKKQLLVDFNDSFSAYPGDKTIHRLFEEQAEKFPDSIAVIGKGHGCMDAWMHGNIFITSRELSEKSDQLANLLKEKGVLADNIVGIMMERSIEMIIGILGILKAGGGYLPLDPDYPRERIDFMLKDSGAKILLTNLFEAGLHHSSNQFIDYHSGSLAYVIYTSGTTGKPKGVLTNHYNVTRVVRNTNYIDIKPEDRILQLSNYAFDGSVFDIYGALLNSAALVMIEREDVLSVDRLGEVIKREKITVFFVTTALFNTLVDLGPECFESVRKVLFGGERVSVEHARKALEYLGKNRIIHVYGPTETTVYAAYYFIDNIPGSADTIPIGKPISNTSIYILDCYLKPVPINVSGEVYIGGAGVSRGYLNNPELTAEKFIEYRSYRTYRTYVSSKRIYRTGDLARWLPDGNLEFIGRIDHQVKIRGFRIELAEIESQLLTHDKIREAVVVSKEDDRGATRYLCAYLVPGDELSPVECREYLSKRLPDYMVPAYFIQMEKIPLTSIGKVDRKALPEPDSGRKPGTDYVPPRNEIEKKLHDIWKEMLAVNFSIGIDDNFFELGGQSLAAMRAVQRVQDVFQVKVPLEAFFQQGTIRHIAQLIDGLQKEAQTEEHIDRQRIEDHSLSTMRLEKIERVKEDV